MYCNQSFSIHPLLQPKSLEYITLIYCDRLLKDVDPFPRQKFPSKKLLSFIAFPRFKSNCSVSEKMFLGIVNARVNYRAFSIEGYYTHSIAMTFLML
jgi:hypothetical protein